MTDTYRHVPDAQLLLHSDGELSADVSAKISTHVQGCSQCRARLEKLESTLAEFSAAHLKAGNIELPSAAVAGARLLERLAEISAQTEKDDVRRPAASENSPLPSGWVELGRARQGVMIGAIAIAACLLFVIWLHGPGVGSGPLSASLGRLEEPDVRLTPGATIPVTRSQVCGAEAEKMIASVPISLRRKVFEEYGVTSPKPDAYEVDYLITPELGGATDIRNLWPEPSQDLLWNSYVKDQLEDRLHRMVCRGDVDLATAQHDISTDWIAAYRKYFHVDTPVTDNSSFDSAGSRSPRPLT